MHMVTQIHAYTHDVYSHTDLHTWTPMVTLMYAHTRTVPQICTLTRVSGRTADFLQPTTVQAAR